MPLTCAVLVLVACVAAEPKSIRKAVQDLQTSEARRSYAVAAPYSSQENSRDDGRYIEGSALPSSSSGSYGQPKSKKTVILAIPVKLALQQPGAQREQAGYGKKS